MNILAAMAAIAFTLGIGGTTEVWGVTDPGVGFVHVAHEVQVQIEQPGQCATAQIATDSDGFVKLAPSDTWVLTGGLELGQVRMSMVGHFVNVAVGYPGDRPPSSAELVLWSIDATGLDKVTVCLP